MIRTIQKKIPTIEVIECDCCGNTLVYDDEIKQSYTTVSKYVPHKNIQHHYCQNCINEGKMNFADNGFSIDGQYSVSK
jgi:hypothetical protein